MSSLDDSWLKRFEKIKQLQQAYACGDLTKAYDLMKELNSEYAVQYELIDFIDFIDFEGALLDKKAPSDRDRHE